MSYKSTENILLTFLRISPPRLTLQALSLSLDPESRDEGQGECVGGLFRFYFETYHRSGSTRKTDSGIVRKSLMNMAKRNA